MTSTPPTRRRHSSQKYRWRHPVIPLALVISCTGVAQADDAERNTLATPDADAAEELKPILVTADGDSDEIKQEEVYTKNVSNLYVDKEELDRFQTANPGDVFKGMNGVYSMDTRSSQSITPNIRGITGEGRTPLTVDGTEQSTNVWLHFFGAGNRSYIDTALLRSVEVEKGPSLSRGIKSGAGGAVSIRTIEPSDIIPEGDNFGIELNAETSGNTSKPRFDASSLYGQDYRNIPGAERAAVTTINVPSPNPRTKDDGEILNFEDHAETLAIAGQNEFLDILLAYSERTTGNYYAGEENADKYSGHDPYAEDTTDRYIPNLTKLYYPGNEVFNTANETKTTLVKNNWYLPNNQKLGLQFMRTDTTFGETTPGQSILLWGYREGAEQAEPDRDWENERQFVYENPHSNLRLDRYRLSYDIKPTGSDWLNLETSLWRTELEGTRYQTGASPYTIDIDQATYDELEFWETVGEEVCPGCMPEPEHDGTIVSKGRQWTRHDRTGFDFSNQMHLTDALQFTFGGGYQKEKLDERITGVSSLVSTTGGVAPDGGMLFASSDRLGPRSGEREEYSAMINLAWQPTNWLTLTAGTRYLHYTGKDIGTAKRRREGKGFYAAERRKDGVELTWGELLTADEVGAYDNLNDQLAITSQAAKPYLHDYLHDGVITPEIQAWLDAGDEQHDWLDGRAHPAWQKVNNGQRYRVWEKTAFVPLKDGKLDSSQNPFANGDIDINEVIEGPYGEGYVNSVTVGGDRIVYQDLDAGQAWEAPEEQSGESFSPVLSATAWVNSHGAVFARYAQTTRFPSINELTSSAITDGAGTLGNLAVNGASKPERSTNWELGYSHDLTQFFPGLTFADARISYYNTEIEDFIDRNLSYDVIQYDKKKTRGIELESRFDTGGFYGSFGASYRLKQKLCDQDYASGMDPFYNRIPSCVTGGFPGTYSGSSLLPKYSVNMTLGTRLLSNRLDLGWRGVYHAGAENKQLNKLLSSENPDDWGLNRSVNDMWFREGVDTFYWKSVLLHDLYANFRVNPSVTVNLGVTNVTNEYYLDPMAKTLMPGPGRTLTAGLKVNF